MKISIITPSYQQGRYIRQNIESVLSQQWSEFEHIIIDGGSTDETIDILKSYPHLKWVSEKDNGQADALNKGLKMATGDVIGWINSDDYYLEGALKTVSKLFYNKGKQWVIGELSLLDEGTSELIPLASPPITWGSLQRNPDIVRQQGAFFRREFLLAENGWNAEFHMVMDFDLWVRLAKRSEPLMLKQQLAVFRIQKDQKSGLGNLHMQTRELIKVLRRENAAPPYIFRVRIIKEWYWLKWTLKMLLISCGMLDKRFMQRPLRGWRNK